MPNNKKISEITSILAKGTQFNGDFKVNGSIRIDGVVEGNIEVSDAIIIGSDGIVKGNIKAKQAIIGGKVEGNIVSDEKLELQKGAEVTGDIACKILVIQEGVIFNGKCEMKKT